MKKNNLSTITTEIILSCSVLSIILSGCVYRGTNSANSSYSSGSKSSTSSYTSSLTNVSYSSSTSSSTSSQYSSSNVASSSADSNVQSTTQSNITTSSSTAPAIKGKVAYLTFDDGPSPNTLINLATLKKYNIHATFFVIHSNWPQYMKNIVADGNQLGIHSYTHNYSIIYSSEAAFWNDFDEINNLVYSETGLKPNIFRFPGGSSNDVSKAYSKGIMTRLTAEMEQKGIQYFDWNCLDMDGSATVYTPEQLLGFVKKYTTGQKELVVLMHDSAPKVNTTKALPSIIDYLKSQGYTFGVLTNDTPPVHQRLAN